MPETPLHRPPTAAELERARRTVAPLSAAVAEARHAAGPGALTLACFRDLHLHATREYPARLPAEKYIRSPLFNPCLMPQSPGTVVPPV
jgi:hypothetical protein